MTILEFSPEMIEDAVCIAGNISNLARRLKVSRESVSLWLMGKSIPNKTNQCKIKRFMKLYSKYKFEKRNIDEKI